MGVNAHSKKVLCTRIMNSQFEGKSHIDVDNYDIFYTQWKKVIKLNTACHLYGCDYDDDGKRVRMYTVCVFDWRNDVAQRSFLYEMRFSTIRFLPKCVFKQQQPTNTIECWIWGTNGTNNNNNNKQQTAAVVFGKQTNNTCAVSPNDRANKQTNSKPTKQYLGRTDTRSVYTPI